MKAAAVTGNLGSSVEAHATPQAHAPAHANAHPHAHPHAHAHAPAHNRAAPAERLGPRLRAAVASFWLAAFFYAAEKLPGLVVAGRRPFCWAVFRVSPWIRAGTLANARRILGATRSHNTVTEVTVPALPGATSTTAPTDSDIRALAERTLCSFYLFCCDVGRSFGMSTADLLARIESADGAERYKSARAAGRGAIVVTAHMGSFEVGMASLRSVDASPIHVVFRRDRFARFERQRSALRARLGVEEAPVDEGWTVWVRLRDALLNNEVVVLQGDRVMPGQKGEAVPFLGGRLMLPPGPVKLALATGAPIVPIFSVRTPGGKVKLFVEDAIEVEPAPHAAGPHPALLRWAALLERYVRTYPDQWLILQPALVDDAPTATATATATPTAAAPSTSSSRAPAQDGVHEPAKQ